MTQDAAARADTVVRGRQVDADTPISEDTCVTMAAAALTVDTHGVDEADIRADDWTYRLEATRGAGRRGWPAESFPGAHPRCSARLVLLRCSTSANETEPDTLKRASLQ